MSDDQEILIQKRRDLQNRNSEDDVSYYKERLFLLATKISITM